VDRLGLIARIVCHFFQHADQASRVLRSFDRAIPMVNSGSAPTFRNQPHL
jgi:hypothetical protein